LPEERAGGKIVAVLDCGDEVLAAIDGNRPSADWTKLVIGGDDFRTNAALYFGPPDAVQVGCALCEGSAKGLDDDKVWICNPTSLIQWAEFSAGG
jgi:hypothetical protein